MTNTHTTADIQQEKVFKTHIVARLTAAVTGQFDVSTYAKSAMPDRRFDAIPEEMGA